MSIAPQLAAHTLPCTYISCCITHIAAQLPMSVNTWKGAHTTCTHHAWVAECVWAQCTCACSWSTCTACRRNCQLWWIQSVYVEPTHRRQGYYRHLYNHVKQAAQSHGAGGLRLYADANNLKAHATVRLFCK